MTGAPTPRPRGEDALPWIVPERCEGCGDCVSACPPGALEMCETAHDGVWVPWLLDVDACTGCGACEEACPWAAVSLTSYRDEALARLEARRPLRPAAGA
ncbi:MAG TPA: 4Fe-4S binding protein [Anaeromyxobacteraceae bacterium]|nr:4Fe-4S binding protein [Anaeromyxobacteraceae bacterium]